MARTYANTPVLSKIKIGNDYYYLKDADARAVLDAIANDVYASLQLNLGTVAAGGDNLVTAANIKTYVDQIAELGFDVVKLNELPHPTAPTEQDYETYHNKIVLVPDAQALAPSCIEYVITRTNTGTEQEPVYTYAWERIGTTQTDLNDYLTAITYNTTTHALSETKGGTSTVVHTFGALADADTASGTYTVVSGAEVTVADTYTFTGTTVTLSVSGEVNDYDVVLGSIGVDTDEGDAITGLGETTATVSYLTNAGTVSAGAAPSFTQGTDSFTQGTDSFTANTPTKLDLTKFSGGSKAADSYTAPSLTDQTTSSFATEGITAVVGTGEDAETLIFTIASTATAVTDRGTFSAGSFTEGTFTAAALNTGFYSEGTAASFTQGTDTYTQGTDTFDEGSVTEVTLPTFEDVDVISGVSPTSATFITGAEITNDPESASVSGISFVTGLTASPTITTFTGSYAPAGGVTASTKTTTVTLTTATATVIVAPVVDSE